MGKIAVMKKHIDRVSVASLSSGVAKKSRPIPAFPRTQEKRHTGILKLDLVQFLFVGLF